MGQIKGCMFERGKKMITLKPHIEYGCGCISIKRKDGFWWNSPCTKSEDECEVEKYRDKENFEFRHETLMRLAKEQDLKLREVSQEVKK